MRSRFRRAPDRIFRVDLMVHRLESIPIIHRLLYIHWRARRAIPADGRIPSKPVEKDNVITWETNISFSVAIPADPSDPTLLQPSPLTLYLRSERRSRWVGVSYAEEGSFQIDLSGIAAVGSMQRSDIFDNSLLNMVLRTSIRVTHISGDKIFRTRNLPQLSEATILNTSAPPTPTPGTSYGDSIGGFLSDDKRDSTERISTDRRPQKSTSNRSLHPSASGISIAGSTASLFQETDAFNPTTTADSVLLSGIPNPEVAQREIYEKMFQDRMRDSWPDYVVNSRVNAIDVVNKIYNEVCESDGIGVPLSIRREPTVKLDPLDDITSPQAGPVTQMLLTRKPSGRSPHLSVRSSSMGEISGKTSRAQSFTAKS